MTSNWNFHTDHVQNDFRNGQFASAESTLVAAGPPKLSQAAQGKGNTDTVYPIGLLENIGIQQSKQLQRVFEIGSSRSYFIPGRVIGSVNLGRVFYYGPSLLRVLYAYYTNDSNNVDIGTSDGGEVEIGTENRRQDPNTRLISLNSIEASSLHKVYNPPGDDYFFVNLASDMFNQPTGLAVYFKDSNANLIGAMYMEECMVQGHQFNVASGSVLIMEGASMQFDRLLPIKAQIT
jgi:hypothetical protein